MKVKFCGIRRLQDVSYCNAAKPDYMGMILSEGFHRSVTLEQAARLVREKRAEIAAVGVFVNETPEKIAEILATVPLDVIQLHGNETAGDIARLRSLTGLSIWKAVRVKSAAEIEAAQRLGADRLILEGYVPGKVGGTGVTADWELIAQNRPKLPFFLAGGLTPENVAAAIRTVQPDGVDFSGGIETDDAKDCEKMKKIIDIVRGEKSWAR